MRFANLTGTAKADMSKLAAIREVVDVQPSGQYCLLAKLDIDERGEVERLKRKLLEAGYVSDFLPEVNRKTDDSSFGYASPST